MLQMAQWFCITCIDIGTNLITSIVLLCNIIALIFNLICEHCVLISSLLVEAPLVTVVRMTLNCNLGGLIVYILYL